MGDLVRNAQSALDDLFSRISDLEATISTQEQEIEGLKDRLSQYE